MIPMQNITVIYERADKAVYAADSAELGPVIIKKDSNIAQLRSEYRMLSVLSGNCCCKVYSFDEQKGILVEERILPGTVLRAEKSLEKRLDVFARVFRAIHTPETEGETYLDWLTAAKSNCERAGQSTDWQARAACAHAICRDLFEKYPDRMLLHGDLHHDNILLRTDGSYAIIDPKGVVGPAILDIPRFILNEIEAVPEEAAAAHVEEVIGRIARLLGYPAEDVAAAFIMEATLANLWCLEDGDDVDQQLLDVALHIAKEIDISLP